MRVSQESPLFVSSLKKHKVNGIGLAFPFCVLISLAFAGLLAVSFRIFSMWNTSRGLYKLMYELCRIFPLHI